MVASAFLSFIASVRDRLVKAVCCNLANVPNNGHVATSARATKDQGDNAGKNRDIEIGEVIAGEYYLAAAHRLAFDFHLQAKQRAGDFVPVEWNDKAARSLRKTQDKPLEGDAEKAPEEEEQEFYGSADISHRTFFPTLRA